MNLNEWRQSRNDTNVFRSLVLSSSDGSPLYKGPIVLDIDSEKEDLEDALEVTKQAIALLTSDGLASTDFRVLETGRKGYNIEIRPDALRCSSSIGSPNSSASEKFRSCVIQRLRDKYNINNTTKNVVSLRGTLIDLNHAHVRLWNSINQWGAGPEQSGVKRQVSIPV